ncbi:GPW/gp25 family protein [Cupriavidus metallidurans]|uniref:Baseplate protein n=1 Tax=Cupriavidus metallidurans TaxID=119219 RepID=A0A482IRW6_9BURK|nr:GPW/gp25 family protein [Cupriavidus metallidurans]QBP09859.1 baseplate protein [Cupriavidus metallidurans]
MSLIAATLPIRYVHWQHRLGALGEAVTGVDDVVQAFSIILRTPKGSDPLRPLFGTRIYQYLDWPIQRARPHVVRESIEALRRWEPRAVVERILSTIDGSRLNLRVPYRLADGIAGTTLVPFDFGRGTP